MANFEGKMGVATTRALNDLVSLNPTKKWPIGRFLANHYLEMMFLKQGYGHATCWLDIHWEWDTENFSTLEVDLLNGNHCLIVTYFHSSKVKLKEYIDEFVKVLAKVKPICVCTLMKTLIISRMCHIFCYIYLDQLNPFVKEVGGPLKTSSSRHNLEVTVD